MFLSKLTNNSDQSEHVTESMLHQFNSLASHAVTHPGTAAEQAHGIKLCCRASLTYTQLLDKGHVGGCW